MLIDIGLNKNNDIDSLAERIGRKWDFSNKSSSNRITYSNSRKRRPASKTIKRGSNSNSKRKRNSRPNSMRREEIMRQYLGPTIKTDNFLNFANAKPKNRYNKLNKSYNFPKSTKSSKSSTPQLKNIFTKK